MTVDRRETHAFSALGVYRETGFELSGVGDPVKIHASHAGAGVFTALASAGGGGAPPIVTS